LYTMEPLNLDDMPERDHPVLKALPKTDPFIVPEGFFDRFPRDVQQLVIASNKPVPAWNHWKKLVIALPMLALFGVAIWRMQREPRISRELAAADVQTLSEEEIDQLDEADALAYLEETPAAVAAELGAVDVQLSEEELAAYLVSENADLIDLIIDTE